MYRNKHEVDRHVKDILRKAKSDDERYARYFNIAKQYYQVQEYESAKRYVSLYLEKRSDMPAAHKLLGNIYEDLGQKEAALGAYKKSLELDSHQDNLVLKVCELLAEDDTNMNIDRAQYWIERADKSYPHHPTIFKLKEKLFSVDKTMNGSEDLETLIKAELEARPSSIQLRVKLLRFYMDKNRLDEAYVYAFTTETNNLNRNSIIWYQVLSELLAKCTNKKQSDYSFWILYLSIVERYAALCIREQNNMINKNIHEATQALINFDQVLNTVTNVKLPSNAAFLEHVIDHMRGQLNFHLSCLIIRKAKRNNLLNWGEATCLSMPLLLTALHTNQIDPAAPWGASLKEASRKLVLIWNKEAAYRCSQSGHVLRNYAKDNAKRLFDKIESFCTKGWRERVFKRVFGDMYQQQLQNSYFVQHKAPELRFRLCSRTELKNYDEIAESVWPASLHHQVWLGVCSRSSLPRYSKAGEPQPNQYSHIFPELQLSVYNLSQVAPETLSQLDVDAFLNAAVLCASASLEAQNHSNLMNPDRLTTLPADLIAPVVSTAQERWWECAYKMYHKKDSSLPLEDDIGEVRQELQRGLEVIRCIGSHGLSPVILVHLARIFQYRAQKLNDSSDPDFAALQARSELYWSVAIPLLERLLNDQMIRTNNCKLFNYEGKDLSNTELVRALEEGRLALVDKVFRKGDNEKAIEELRKLRSPEASFKQGKIYKKLAEELDDNDSSEIKHQRLTLLLKSRNSFYLTLDRLRCPDVDPKHPLNAEIYNYISVIDNELTKIDPEIIKHDSNKYQTMHDTDESYASAYSDEENVSYGINSTLNLSNSNLTPHRNNSRVKVASTPSRSMSGARLNLSRSMSQEARPSPEKLEAQMRQLMSRDTVIQTIIKQNKELIESNKTLTEKLDGMMKELSNLKLEISKNTETTLSASRSGAAAHDETVEEDYSEYYAQAMAAQQTPQPAVPKAAAFPAMPPGYCSPNLMVRPDKYQPMALPPLYPTIPYAGYGNATAQPTPPMFLPPRGYPYGAMYSGDMYTQPMDHLDSEVERMLQRMSKSTPQMAPQFAAQNISQEIIDTVTPNLAAQVDKPLSSTPKAVFGVATAAPNRVPSASAPSAPAGAPHNYQISMPSQANIPTTVNLPPLSTTLTTAISNLSSSITAQNSSVVSTGSHNNSDLYPEQEHDPIPDFKPVIPLPAEVAVTTGEEDETTLFCARAKLFRFVEKEWKERGIGNLKILKNKEGKVRILMRREQVLKICANHYLQSDMELTPMPKNDKAWIWVANDFADEQVRLEKLCVKFKTAKEAQEFKTSFDNARANLPASPPKKNAANKSSEKVEKKSDVQEDKTSQIKLGGFSFSGKPVIQEKTQENTKEKKVEEQQSTKPSPFAGFSFTKAETPAQSKGFIWDVKQPETPADIQMSEVKVIEYQAILKSCSGPNLDVWTETSTGQAVVLKDKPTGGIRIMVKKGSKVLCSLPVTKDNSFTQEGKVVICVLKEAGKIKSKHSLEFQNIRTGSDFIKGVTSPEKEDENKKPLSELFKSAAGSWDCEDCYTRNIAGATKCVACMGPAPQTAATTVAPPPTAQPAKVDSKKPLSELFKPAAGSWECPDCYTRNNSTASACIACCRAADNAAPPSKSEVKGIDLSTTKTFSFGLPASTIKDKSSGFNFQMTKAATEGTTGFTFGAKPAAQPTRPVTPPRATSPVASPYTFGSPGKSFGFQFHSKSPVKSPGAAEHSESEEVEQSEDVYFAPVVPLPDKIDVKTGEESEEVLYSHRAKLFRFDSSTKEWKERGLGDIKLLRHETTKKLRLVMRRDQILKLCLNHVVTQELEITQKDNKTWLWSAADFSDGEIEYHQFACRFKTPEIAQKFKKAIDNALSGPGDDIKIVFENEVTDEEKDQATKLQLPEKFFAYKQKEDCPGCRGCEEPEYSLEKPKASDHQEEKEKEKSIFGAAKPTQAFSFNPGEFIFGQNKKETAASEQATANSDATGLDNLTICSPKTATKNPEPVFGKSTLFGSALSAGNIFANKHTFDNVPKAVVFGSETKPATIFSGETKPATIFGGEAKSTTMFGGEAKTTTMFGGDSKPSMLFGSESKLTSVSGESKPSSIFGGEAKSGTMFGGEAKSVSIFGGNIPKTDAASKFSFTGSLSGSTLFGSTPVTSNLQNKTETTAEENTIESLNLSAPVFGAPLFGNSGTGIFANTTPSTNTLFGGITKKDDKSESDNIVPATPSFLMGEKTSLSFSTLAAQGEQKNAFKKESNFKFDGAGSTVFGAKSSLDSSNRANKTNDLNESTNAEDEAEEENDAEHDPHFEPIVPLPEIIEVRTGEEEEDKLFCERAKLFRFDGNTKEWKERGVGEIKVLRHAERGTYRLLLRREQVYKIVLNLLLTSDLEFLPLQSSDKAWMWAGMNYAEEPYGVEQLAVRFKTSDLAKQFKQVVDEAQECLREKQNQSQGD